MSGAIKFHIHGAPAPAARSWTDADVLPFLTVTERTCVNVPISTRGAPAASPSLIIGAETDDVIELQFEGDVHQFVNAGRLHEDIRKQRPVSRGAGGNETDAVEVPLYFGSGQTRGVAGELLLKGLRVLGFDPVSKTSDQAVRLVLSQFEDKLDPVPGLYRLTTPNVVGGRVSDAKELDANKPYLLFLHGTASSISGSFGGLAPATGKATTEWDALVGRYEGRILGLQHKTFSESPVTNAIAAANLLPQGATLHLVSHSRGGLIGELLCLTELEEVHLRAFQAASGSRLDDTDAATAARIRDVRNAEADNIKRLADIIRSKRLQVERFVRVACPARGTLLASRRLDIYLSVLLNVIEFIPALKESILYSFVKAVVLETARRRTDPRELPGIEAMMPESPLIHVLNQPTLRSRADLAVISGDLAPDKLWKRIALLAVQVLYLEDNDLVVNTQAMYGGMQRVRKASYFFNKGPHVNHFHYFANPGTRGRMKGWLLASPGAPVEGFTEFVPQQKEFKADTRRAAQTDTRPVLFIIPDVFGSVLSRSKEVIWPSISALAEHGVNALQDNDAAASGLIPEYYADITNEFQGEYLVERFPWDWRKPLSDSIAILTEAVARYVEDSDSKKARRVCVLGHGSGGTLGLMLASQPIWTKVRVLGGRLVMLGSAIQSNSYPELLRHCQGRLSRMLKMLDPQSDRTANDFLADVAKAQRPPSDLVTPENATYVAGTALQTPLSVAGDEVRTTSAGDGHVTWAEPGKLKLPAWQMAVTHGDLVRSNAGFAALRDLLSRGITDKLPQLPVVPVTQDSVFTLGEPLLYPSESDLMDAALGGTTPSQLREVVPPLNVWIKHGDLRHAEDHFPLLVGHYREDSIVSAEKQLDRALDGRLTQRFMMAIYPGPDRTSEVILAPTYKPAGALVIGLGEVGELTPEKVRRAVASVLLRYVLDVTQSPCATVADPRKIGFSALLVGAYGELSIRQSLGAIVGGALEANRQLRETGPRIDSLEIIDLYEDVAIEAAHELMILEERTNSDSGARQLAAEPLIRTVEGGQTSRPINPHETGWWRRIKIAAAKDQSLQFVVLTDRAQADEYVQGTQRKLVAEFIRSAVEKPDYNANLSATLFQLLVPRRLHDSFSDRVNVVLVLDRDSAQYPWELLAQRTRTDVEPLATTCGIVRQFHTPTLEGRLIPAFGNAALVIGDTNSGLPPLPSAREEGLIVAGKLSAAGRDTRRLAPDIDPLNLVSELLSRPYQIVHLAAHGEYDPDDAARSGVVIGKDLHLTPYELRGMSAAPDLVFVNCCYLGGINLNRPGPELAASFAETLINMGVRAVVTAGWAVDDEAGKTFASRFYDRMFEGDGFGQAILDARKRTAELHPGSNTWGAYQCYGNPDFRLQQPRDAARLSGKKEQYVARKEVLQRVRDLVAAAAQAAIGGTVSADEEERAKVKSKLREQVDELRQLTPLEWRDGEVLEAFGQAYANLGDNAEAIACYEQALADEAASTRAKLIQNLANLLDRTGHKDSTQAGTMQVKRAEELLLALEKIMPTAETWSLLAAFYKRDGNDQKALENYEKSFEKRKETGHEELYYPGVNAAALAFALGDQDRDKWSGVLTRCVEAATAKRRRNQDFWSRATIADALLVQSLWDNDLSDKKNSIMAAYQDVIKGGGAPNYFDSMLTQLRFLASRCNQPDIQNTLQEILDQVSSEIPR